MNQASSPISLLQSPFSRGRSAKPSQEKVVLDVLITPYARNEYRFLSRHLAPAASRRIAMTADDLLGISGRLRHASGRYLDVHVGLQDAKVEYVIEEGKVKRKGAFKRSTFAERNSYAAVTPQERDGLKLLSQFLSSV